MGTLVTLRAEGSEAQAAIDESFDKVNELVDKIKGDVERINAAAGSDEFIQISPEVFEMIRLSRQYSERTDGAFDVTVGAALELWKAARQNNALPTDAELDATRQLVGWRHMNLRETDNAVMLDAAGVKINLGGVAKGYAADLVKKFLKLMISSSSTTGRCRHRAITRDFLRSTGESTITSSIRKHVDRSTTGLRR